LTLTRQPIHDDTVVQGYFKEAHSMFNIGLPEILIIAFVAVIFIDPKQLPGLFRNLGKGVQQMKRMREDFTKGIQEVQNDLGLADSGPRRQPDSLQRKGPSRQSGPGPAGSEAETWNEGEGI
jgi:Sec-independent protein translocase protein TatA